MTEIVQGGLYYDSDAQRVVRQKFRKVTRTVERYKLPDGSPCLNCVQSPSSSICESECPYWPTLKRMRDNGELETVTEQETVLVRIDNRKEEEKRD